MECVVKPSQPPPNISEIVAKFSKVCRFRSVGVFTSENPSFNLHQHVGNGLSMPPFIEDSNTATEESQQCDNKVFPQPVYVKTKGNGCDHAEIFKLFDTVSALKSAYVQFQQAHIPYDPNKIRSVDEVIVSQLELLCKLKRAYNHNQFEEAKYGVHCSSNLLADIQVQEALLQKLKAEAIAKSVEMLNLQGVLTDLDKENKKLVEEVKQREKENIRTLSSSNFQGIVKLASMAIHDFAKPLIALMKVSGWNLDRAADSIEESIVYSKRCHKKYAFEAYIARRMFHGNSFQSYHVDGIMNVTDSVDALIEDPHSCFEKFCRMKYLLVVHPRMEVSFFGNLDHRAMVSTGKHPRTPFYQAFAKMARWIWLLLEAAASIKPKVEIFIVKRGSEFSDVYMEPKEGMAIYEDPASFLVELMVMPGFRIGDETLVKSQVYITKLTSPTVA